jgi:hypothetical protein
MVRDPEGPGRTRSVSPRGAGGDRYHLAAEKTGASQGIKENGQVSAQTATAADSQASKATIDLGNHAGGKPGRNRRKISAACDIAIAHSLSRSAAARSFFTLRSAIEALSPKPGQLIFPLLFLRYGHPRRWLEGEAEGLPPRNWHSCVRFKATTRAPD